jgi:hypothetical protein
VAEQDRASRAGTGEPARASFQQVLVIVGQLGAAQFAPLAGRARPGEAA